MATKTSFCLLMVLSLSACSDGALGLQESMAWHLTASDETKRTYFAEECAAFGYREGTEGMDTCIAGAWTDSKLHPRGGNNMRRDRRINPQN